MIFKEMSEAEREEILKQYRDEDDALNEEMKELEFLFDKFSTCQKCGHRMTKRLHPTAPFTPGYAVPNMILHCDYCGYEHDPKTGLVLNVGDTKKALQEVEKRRIKILDPSDS